MMARDFAVKVDDFRKVYGDFAAVDGISFAVERGEVFGLLGLTAQERRARWSAWRG